MIVQELGRGSTPPRAGEAHSIGNSSPTETGGTD